MRASLRTTAGRERLFWALLPHGVFAVLYAATFQRWVLPFEDSGREMNTALRLAGGRCPTATSGIRTGLLPRG